MIVVWAIPECWTVARTGVVQLEGAGGAKGDTSYAKPFANAVDNRNSAVHYTGPANEVMVVLTVAKKERRTKEKRGEAMVREGESPGDVDGGLVVGLRFDQNDRACRSPSCRLPD